MSEESFWVRAYIRRGADLDVVKEIECVSEAAAATTATRLWEKQIYDRVAATCDRAGSPQATQRPIAAYGHAATATAKAPADYDTAVPEAFGVRPRTAPKA